MIGMPSRRDVMRNTHPGLPKKEKRMIEPRTTMSRKLVPHRGCSGGAPHRFDTQGLSGLEGVDRHVLRAVVLEGAPDLGGAADRPDVTDEEGEADHPFGDVEQDPRFARKRTAASAGRMMKIPRTGRRQVPWSNQSGSC